MKRETLRLLSCAVSAQLLVLGLSSPAVFAANGIQASRNGTSTDRNGTSTDKNAQAIAPLEQQFFQQVYTNDLFDKRLQRFELLFFGVTQEGTQAERLAHIRAAAAQRSAGAKVSGNASSVQTQLNSIEKKLFKKTYPSQSTDQRLSRIEQKTLGQTNSKLSAQERLQRLARIIGAPENNDELSNLPGAAPMQPGFGGLPIFPPGAVPGFRTFRSFRQFSSPNSTDTPFGMMPQFHIEMEDGEGNHYGFSPPQPQATPFNGNQQRPRRYNSPNRQFATPREPSVEQGSGQLPPYMDANSI